MDYQKQIRNKLAKLPRKKMDAKSQAFIQHYLGTNKEVLGIKIGEILEIAREVVKDQNNISINELVNLLNQLFSATTFEEHAIGGKIFTLLKPEKRGKIPFSKLEKWLAKARGWVEIDTICQSTFTAPEVLERWSDWEKTIKKFRASDNISLRRASLVLQNPSVRKTDNKKIRQLAFNTVDQLRSEKDVLITKAVSWLLRSLVAQNKYEVRAYLTANEHTLPRIAFRETMKKIETGKKTK